MISERTKTLLMKMIPLFPIVQSIVHLGHFEAASERKIAITECESTRMLPRMFPPTLPRRDEMELLLDVLRA